MSGWTPWRGAAAPAVPQTLSEQEVAAQTVYRLRSERDAARRRVRELEALLADASPDSAAYWRRKFFEDRRALTAAHDTIARLERRPAHGSGT